MTCAECGYNLPHHAEGCSHVAPLVWACVEHRPAGTVSRTDDGRTGTCGTCGARGAKGYR